MKRALLASCLLCAPAAAQQPPATLPTRDVTVTYRIDGAARQAVPGGLPETATVEWSAQRQALRVQAQGRGQVLLVDLRATTATLLDTNLHGAIALPVKPRDLDPVRLKDARLRPTGQETVAGLPCTDYAVDAKGGHGTVCLTGDGLALRAEGDVDGRHGSLLALSVAYGPLPAERFTVPRDTMHLSIPGLGRFP